MRKDLIKLYIDINALYKNMPRRELSFALYKIIMSLYSVIKELNSDNKLLTQTDDCGELIRQKHYREVLGKIRDGRYKSVLEEFIITVESYREALYNNVKKPNEKKNE